MTQILPGVVFTGDKDFALDAKSFTRCQAEGVFYSERKGAVVRCDLRARLLAISYLRANFFVLWKKALHFLDLSIALENHFDFIEKFHLAMNEKKYFSKGLVLPTKRSDFIQPSFLLWLLALEATWRYGVPVHVVSLAKSSSLNLLPALNPQKKSPPMVFLEQAGSLRNIAIRSDLETLVSYCEKAKSPLWLDLMSHQMNSPFFKRTAGEEPLLSRVKERVHKLRSKPALSELLPDTRSRLQMVCHGVKAFF